MQDDEILMTAFPVPEDADIDEIMSVLRDDVDSNGQSSACPQDGAKRKGVRITKAAVKANMAKTNAGSNDGYVNGQQGAPVSPWEHAAPATAHGAGGRQGFSSVSDDLVPPPPPDFMYDEVDDSSNDFGGAPTFAHQGMMMNPEMSAQHGRDSRNGGRGQNGHAVGRGAMPPQHGAPNGMSNGRGMASRQASPYAEQNAPAFNDYVDPVESARAFRHSSSPRSRDMQPMLGNNPSAPWQGSQGQRGDMRGGSAHWQQGNGNRGPQQGFTQNQGWAGHGAGRGGAVPGTAPSVAPDAPMGRRQQQVGSAWGAPQDAMVVHEPVGGRDERANAHAGTPAAAPSGAHAVSGEAKETDSAKARSDADLDAQIVRSMAGPKAKAMAVSEFMEITNNFLGSLGDAVISGELSQINNRKHMYFTLKDSQAKVDCLMFYSDMRKLSFTPQEGQKVFVQGKSSVYKAYGQFKFLVSNMRLAGNGMILEQLRQLERQLEQEGVFSRKWPLPPVIQRVAIVTSVDGRVIDDIAKNVYRRNPLVEMIFLDTKVQGQEAAGQIINALNYAYANARKWGLDVIIIGRGGGSFDDLLCFSDEQVVRKVAMSPVPIISAVGHHEDCPLCDRAADLRVSTPTAAAEIITPYTRHDLLAFLEGQIERAENSTWRRLDDYEMRLDHLLTRLKGAPLTAVLDRREAKLNELSSHLEHAMYRILNNLQVRLSNARTRLEHVAGLDRMHEIRLRIESAINRLESVDARLRRAKSRTYHYQERLGDFIRSAENRINELSYALDARIIPRIASGVDRLVDSRVRRLSKAEQVLNHYHDRVLNLHLSAYDNKLVQLTTKLKSLDPLYQLDLGLSVTTKDGMHSIKGEDLSVGDTIITLMQGYKVTSNVTNIEEHEFKSTTVHLDDAT